MNSLINFFDGFINKLLISLMFLIILTVTWQVFSRYILQSPSSGSEELARFLLIWIGMLGSVYCYRTKAHLGLNILVNKMPAQQQKMAVLFSHTIIFVFAFSALLLGGFNLVSLTFNPVQISAALGINIGYVYSIIPLSGGLFCFYAIVEFIDALQNHSEFSGEK